MTARLATLALTILIGCSSAGSAVTTDDVTGETHDLNTGETHLPDVTQVPDEGSMPDAPDAPDLFVFEALPETLGPQCEAGEGCFLDPCQTNEDCLSGWCVGHMGEDVCTLQCQSECPPGWSCQQVPGTAPDVVWVCVSDHANLCLPCGDAADCKGAAGADSACLDYGMEGSFCGGKCGTDDDCPWGFACVETQTVDGVTLTQCVANTGICPCTTKSIELGLTTPCAIVNDFGECTGQRICTASGLSACDAGVPVAETCNGLDDDCDGEVDEPEVLEGEYVSLCNDDNPCTKDTCSGEEGCVNLPLAQGECVDGDACTVGDHCQDGVCAGSPVACDDSNPCTDDLCDGLGGCTFTNNSAKCDDSDPCTVADECEDGVCAGVAVNCQCQSDDDCQALEDGDLCNGTLVCNTDSFPYQCQVDEESVVECPLPEPGPSSFCQAPSCNPSNGICAIVPANEGMACDDTNPCTMGEHCIAGSCTGGSVPNCNDGNLCTDDQCAPETGCVNMPNASICDDGDTCTTNDICKEGSCVGGGQLACDDANPCTLDSCNAKKGCEHQAIAGDCDDGNACTQGDSCVNGFCQGGSGVDCNDDNPCTTDSCDSATGCLYSLATGPCDDGNPCTINDGCVNGECAAGPNLDCADGNPCTDDSCQEGACLHAPNDADCSDGNACTVGDVCTAGKCTYSGLANCDDDNVCTDDSCDPATGCVHLLGDGPCNDGNLCTVGDYCHLGECIAADDFVCDDGNDCTDDSCNGEVGCQFIPNSAPCDDGNACTVDDGCKAGWCAAGAVALCTDDNPCTDNTCDPDSGCLVTNNSAACDDGDPCTVTDACSDGQCIGTGELPCSDGNDCTLDSCATGQGCLFTPITPCCGNGDKEGGEACDDGNDVDDDGCRNDCTLPSVSRTVPGFGGTLGPDLSGQGWSQCAGTGSKGTMGKQWYPLCENHGQIRFACSVDNNESAEYTSPAFPLAGKTLLDNQCDNWTGASNSIYGSDYILSVDQSNPGCGNYNVGYQMYLHFGTQWGCNGSTNTHNTGGRMFAYVKD